MSKAQQTTVKSWVFCKNTVKLFATGANLKKMSVFKLGLFSDHLYSTKYLHSTYTGNLKYREETKQNNYVQNYIIIF